MNPLSRTKSGSSGRGRSRERRDSFDDDDDDNSFESWESASSDDDTYETESDRHLGHKGSTEYESDDASSGSSYISDSEPPTPISTDHTYTSAEESLPEDANIISMDSVRSHSGGESDMSTSGDEFADASHSDSEESDLEDGENSFGEFNVEDDRFRRNRAFDDDDDDESDLSGSESESDSESDDEEERVKLGQADDDLFWKRYGYSQKVGGTFGDDSKGTDPFGGDEGIEKLDTESGKTSEFDDGDTFKDELYSQAFPSIARMQDSREEIADPERSNKSGVEGLFSSFGKAKDWIQSKVPKFIGGTNSSRSNQRDESHRSNSWFDFSDVLQGKFKWYIIGAVIIILLAAIIGGATSKKNRNKNTIDKNAKPTTMQQNLAPTAKPTMSFLPTLPTGQVMERITFFFLIPNGKESGITETDIEMNLMAVFDVLAPQVLLNTTSNNTINTNEDMNENKSVVLSDETVNGAVRLRGRRSRRKMEGLSITSTSINAAAIDCPDLSFIDELDLCLRAKVHITVMTEDGTIGFDYSTAMKDTIEAGTLQTASDEFGLDMTIVILDAEDIVTPSPTMTFSPTMSPAPSISPAPTSSCYDKDINCEVWASSEPSECKVNPEYMLLNCMKSCDMCVTESPTTAPPTITPSSFPTITNTETATATATANPPTNATSQNSTAYTDLDPSNTNFTKVPQDDSTAAPTTTSNSTTSAANSTAAPSESSDTTIPPTTTPLQCFDKNEACAESMGGVCLYTKCVLWAGEGECEANPTYMWSNCAKSCDRCGPDQVPSESPTAVNDSGTGPNPTPTAPPIVPGCVDDNDECTGWAEAGECAKNPIWMLQNCKKSCNNCQSGDDADEETESPIPSCFDTNERCAEWAGDDECESNPIWMLENCKLSCNVCEGEDETQPSFDGEEPIPTPEPDCKDLNEVCRQTSDSGDCLLTNCEFWATEGECESNPSYMLDNCSKSCGKCETIFV